MTNTLQPYVACLRRGNGASVLRIVPYAAIHFSAYEYYRRYLLDTFVTPSQHSVHAANNPSSLPNSSSSSNSSNSLPSANSSALPDSVHPSSFSAQDSLLAGGATGTAEMFSPSQEVNSGALQDGCSSTQSTCSTSDANTRHPTSHSIQTLTTTSHATKTKVEGKAENSPSGLTHPVWDLLAGSTAGATAVMLTYPLDLVRTRLAYAMAAPKILGASSGSLGGATVDTAAAVTAAVTTPAAGIRSVLLRTFQTEGVIGLYRGVLPTLMGIMPYAGIKFFTYSLLKNKYRENDQLARSAALSQSTGGREQSAEQQRLPIHMMLMFGATSGLLAQSATYPFDMLRRRMQVQGMQVQDMLAGAPGSKAVVELGLVKMFQLILKEEGVRGLFRGLSVNYIKVIPSTAIGFALYDSLKAYMDLQGSL